MHAGGRLWHRPDAVRVLFHLSKAMEIERSFVAHALSKRSVRLIPSEYCRRPQPASRVPPDHVCLPVRNLRNNTCADRKTKYNIRSQRLLILHLNRNGRRMMPSGTLTEALCNAVFQEFPIVMNIGKTLNIKRPQI